jgi:hypothetical protein
VVEACLAYVRPQVPSPVLPKKKKKRKKKKEKAKKEKETVSEENRARKS